MSAYGDLSRAVTKSIIRRGDLWRIYALNPNACGKLDGNALACEMAACWDEDAAISKLPVEDMWSKI